MAAAVMSEKRKEIGQRSQAVLRDIVIWEWRISRRAGFQLTPGMILTYRTRLYHLCEDGSR